MARDVYLGLFVMTFVLILQLSLSPHYGSTSGIAPVRRDGVGFFGSEDPKVAVFAETHNEKYTSTQNHPQLNSLVRKASTKALTSVATVAARSRRAIFVALEDFVNQHAIHNSTRKSDAQHQSACATDPNTAILPT